ncbi:MAG: hypothetical protein P8Y65_02600 [Campylobacterales bacterium]
MNLETLKDRSILLFGTPRSLTPDEFERLLAAAGIALADAYGDGVAAVIEGRLVNPIEQDELDRLYEEHRIVPVDINLFEKALCSQIDPDRIMMSLKLSRDRERLRAFLRNPHIDDAFFLKLLGLYDWGDEGFFDTDENRDVTAALIGRFYEHIERNHNVQYSTLGLMHLIGQNRHPELIRILGTLLPLRRAVSTHDRQLRAILEALAIHPATDETTLKHFVRQGDDALRALVAERPELDAALQRELFRLQRPEINAALAANPDLDSALADSMLEDETLAEIGYAHIRLDDGRFNKGLGSHPCALAANATLTAAMQQRLFDRGDRAVRAALAANPSLKIVDALVALRDTEVLRALAANPVVAPDRLEALAGTGTCDAALAANPSSPAPLLERLYAKGDTQVLSALAGNPATPVTLLQQLQLDARFERAVRTNEAFGEFIKRENIGWL